MTSFPCILQCNVDRTSSLRKLGNYLCNLHNLGTGTCIVYCLQLYCTSCRMRCRMRKTEDNIGQCGLLLSLDDTQHNAAPVYWDQRPTRMVQPVHSASPPVVVGLYCVWPTDHPTHCLRWRHRSKHLGVYMAAVVEKCRYLRNDDHYRHKNQQKSWTWSSRVCVPNLAIVRCGV